MTPNGAWSWCSDPRTFVRGPRVFAGWVTSEGDVQIGSVDVSNGHRVIVDLAPRYEPDDHDNPAFVETSDARWTAFYSKHAGYEGTHYRVSVDPGAIGRWRTQAAVGTNTPGSGGATYAHAFAVPGETDRFLLFWRGGDWKPTYSVGTYSPETASWTWSDARTLITHPGERPYAKYWSDGSDRIGVAFTDGHPGETDNNVYYAAIAKDVVGELAFYRANGDWVGDLADGPLWSSQADTVFDRLADPASTGDNSWVWDVGFDGHDRPVVVYATFPSPDHHQYHWARFEASHWNDVVLVEDAGGSVADTTIGLGQQAYYSGGIALDHRDPTVVYLSRANQIGGWDVERWAMDGGGAWSVVEITSGSTEKNMRPAVPVDAPPFVDMVVWMSGSYEYWENLGAESSWPVDGNGATYQTALKLWVDGPSADAGEPGVVTDAPLLRRNRPNPFRTSTVLPYSLPLPCNVTLRIVDGAGRAVRTLARHRPREPGVYQAVWDGTDAGGRRVASGVYFCQLEAGGIAVSRKLVLLD